jgi:MoxR-like ATPase
MFGVILKSSTPVGIRSVAIVPANGEARVFSRIGEGRGVAGAWHEGDIAGQFFADEKLVSSPRAVTLSPTDLTMLQYPVTPTVLLQKLNNKIKDTTVVTTVGASDIYDFVTGAVVDTPLQLSVYLNPMPLPVAQPTPVVAPVVEVAPEPVAVTEPTVVSELTPTIHTHKESEPAMTLTVPEVTSPSNAIIHVPPYAEYYKRTFNGLTETEVYNWARAHQLNVLLTGDAGTGKTSSVANYAYEHSLPMVTIELTQQIDQSITQGRFVPTGVGNATRWVYSQLATAIQQPSVILLNEMTRMSPKSASLFLRLLQERELLIEPLNQVIKVHPDCIIIADQNVGYGYTGTSKQDGALLDRFNIKLEFKYDDAIESKFIKSKSLLEFANSIRSAAEFTDQYSVPMSTRLLKSFQAQATGLNFEFAVMSLLSAYPKSDGEREALKMSFDTLHDKIAEELGVPLGSYSA